jgi:hypothetical protein
MYSGIHPPPRCLAVRVPAAQDLSMPGLTGTPAHIVGAHERVGGRDIPQWAVLDFNSKLIDLNFGDDLNMIWP